MPEKGIEIISVCLKYPTIKKEVVHSRITSFAYTCIALIMIKCRSYSCQYFLSRERYWIASLMCGARITSLWSRSAMVRATFMMRS